MRDDALEISSGCIMILRMQEWPLSARSWHSSPCCHAMTLLRWLGRSHQPKTEPHGNSLERNAAVRSMIREKGVKEESFIIEVILIHNDSRAKKGSSVMSLTLQFCKTRLHLRQVVCSERLDSTSMGGGVLSSWRESVPFRKSISLKPSPCHRALYPTPLGVSILENMEHRAAEPGDRAKLLFSGGDR